MTKNVLLSLIKPSFEEQLIQLSIETKYFFGKGPTSHFVDTGKNFFFGKMNEVSFNGYVMLGTTAFDRSLKTSNFDPRYC